MVGQMAEAGHVSSSRPGCGNTCQSTRHCWSIRTIAAITWVSNAREEIVNQRLSGVSDREATGLAKEIMEASTLFLGRTSNLLRILSKHSPYLARWLLGFVAAVRQPNLGASSDVRLRNLATIKTSLVNECKYCASHTSIFAETLVLKPADIQAL